MSKKKCSNVIPNTFVICGENGNFCSEKCYNERQKKIDEKKSKFNPGDLAIIAYDLVPYWVSDDDIQHPLGYFSFGDVVTTVFLSRKMGANYWYVTAASGSGFVYEINMLHVHEI